MQTPSKGKEKVVDCQEEDNDFFYKSDFVKKLKVRNENLYLAFLQAMSSYRTKLKEANVHINEVLTLLVDSQDLKNEFIKIMTIIDSGASSSSTEKNDNEVIEKQLLCFFKKVQEKLSETNFMLFMRCFHSYSNGNINKEELTNTITSMINEFPQLIAEFNLLMKNSSIKAESNQELEKSLTTENDKALKRRRLIQSEEMKMKREDDMYELDMLLSWFKSAANYAKILSEGRREETDEAKIRKIHLKRCIERLYGDYSEEVLEILHENPKHASSVVLTRLNQKIEELQIFEAEMKNIWAQLR